ncbi:MAG: SDR family NAD(P)-dependent oxidoreductase [Pseudomonadota bacterium]|nr:SDR family NAD(P)-dependent oxidoreductase [Pseudomonadota bacterium]
MSERIFITGNSSGLGRGFTRHYLRQGAAVYGLSRRGCEGLEGDLHDIHCDLSDLDSIAPALEILLQGVERLDLVILNAGILGVIQDMHQTSVSDLREIMEINLWANKVILDRLLGSGPAVDQIVLISSGAAVNGSKGWGGYSISKAALNMLTRLYAAEFPDTHLCALAPGLVDTPMQDYLCDPASVDAAEFPSVQKLRNARGTANMPTADQAAVNIAAVIPRLKAYPSGEFLDVRTM